LAINTTVKHRLWIQLPDSFRQPRQSCLDHFLIHLSPHLCHYHDSHHPPLLHSFTPGSKPTFSTNPTRVLLLPWTAFTIAALTGPDRAYHASRFFVRFFFIFFCLFRVVDLGYTSDFYYTLNTQYHIVS